MSNSASALSQAGATTSSLQALRLYSEAQDVATRGQWAQSEKLARAALDLDPKFASAMNWLGGSLFNLQHPREVCLPYFEQAFELSKATPDRERYFIEGSYQNFTGDVERAIASYQALLRLYPDHTWGVNNLITAMERAGRRHETVDEIAKLAQRRPDDLNVVLRAAVQTLAAKGIEAARPYAKQAQSLSARQRPQTAVQAMWVALFDAHEHWLAGRAEEAGRSLEAFIASGVGGPQAPVAAGHFYLALGRANAAAALLQEVPEPALKSLGLGHIALAREQPSEVIRQLQDYPGGDAASVLILLQAGERARAQNLFKRILERTSPSVDEPEYDFIRAQVDATVPVSAKLEVLTRVETSPLFWDTARYCLHVETLASLLEESGSRGAALRVLQRASTFRDRAHRESRHIGYFWMRVQKRLADLYRTLGRNREAEAVEADLLRVLATADPDFPLLVELRARSVAAQKR
jgi:tetratricopeptide (TPR) repeat protein